MERTEVLMRINLLFVVRVILGYKRMRCLSLLIYHLRWLPQSFGPDFKKNTELCCDADATWS